MSLFGQDDVTSLRTDRLIVAAGTYAPGVVLTDTYLLSQILAAEAEVARRLRVLLEPTTVFAYPVTEAETDALDGAPWVEEAAYDYDQDYFWPDRWGYLVTRQRPVISVAFVRLNYPNPTTSFFTIPADWLRLDKKYGHLRFVPASATAIVPLGAYMLQVLGGGTTIPAMIELRYTAGLSDARNKWPDLVDVILKLAAVKVVEGFIRPASASISADGLSQSLSVKTSDYRDLIETQLFGPKGCNGGLKTAIHGIGVTVAGVLG